MDSHQNDTLWIRYSWLVFGVGLLVALAVVFVFWRSQQLVANLDDPYNFVAMARDLTTGRGFDAWGSVLNRRGPLYPGFLAAIFIVTDESAFAARLAQAFLQAGICWLAFDIGRRLYNLRTGLIAGLICAFHPSLLRYVADFHLETFFTFLVVLTIWSSVRFLERPTLLTGVGMGVVAALAALTKPVTLLHPLAFAAWWLYLERKKADALPMPKRLIAVAAIFVAMGVVILPWTYRNYRSSGHFILITTGVGDAFLRGFIFSKTEYALLQKPPYTFAEMESNALFEKLCAEKGTVWQRNDVESERILTQASKEKLRAEPLLFVRKFCVQMFTFWYQMTSLKNSLVAGGMALIAWVFALIGWRRARREGKISWVLFAPILCLNIALALLLALGRYSVPILPALTIVAAFGLESLLPKRASEPTAI